MGKAYLEIHKPARSQFRKGRRAKPTGAIGLHTAESVMDTVGPDTGAENVARFIVNRTDAAGSYHRLVDSDSYVPLVRFGDEAYGAGTGSNPYIMHLSFACRTTDWVKMSRTRRLGFLEQGAARVVEYARWLKKHHGVTFQVREITKKQADAGMSGFVTHADLDPGRRSDPGADFPMDEFMVLVNAKLNPKKVTAKPKGDKKQNLRRAILAAEKSAAKAAADARTAASEARKIGRNPLASRFEERAKHFTSLTRLWKKRRISLRVK